MEWWGRVHFILTDYRAPCGRGGAFVLCGRGGVLLFPPMYLQWVTLEK